MKNLNFISSIAAASVCVMIIAGCSTNEPEIKKADPSALIKKHNSLPAWINSEDKDSFCAVGSARYKNQTYTQQKSEASLIASAELVEKMEKRVNALMKSYHQSTGQADAQLEDVFRKTSSSIASQTIAGVVVKDVYVSDDGEMFVRVGVDPKFLSNVLANDLKTNKTAWQQIQAQKAFDELKKESKEYRDDRDAAPKAEAGETVEAAEVKKIETKG